MIGQALKDCKILVCRPEPSATELASVLSSVGAKAEVLSCIEVHALTLTPEDLEKVLNLDRYEHIIAVSQHAAERGLRVIDEYWPQFPARQNWYAIGRKTAQELRASGVNLIEPHNDLTSERLLELPELKKIKGKKVLILKGKNGREALARELRNRSAKVDTIDLYERKKPHQNEQTLKARIADFLPEYIITLSGETLLNLISFAQQAGVDIRQRKLIVSSARVAEIAHQHGFKLTYVPSNLMPIDIIRCIAKAKGAEN